MIHVANIVSFSFVSFLRFTLFYESTTAWGIKIFILKSRTTIGDVLQRVIGLPAIG